MPDNDGKPYLFEALALREAHDQRIALLEKLLDPKADRRGGPRFGFSDGEEISLAQALELRKSLLAERAELAQRVVDSAYNRIIHKEERDVVKAPNRPFRRTHDEFHTVLERARALVTAIRRANHTVTVACRVPDDRIPA